MKPLLLILSLSLVAGAFTMDNTPFFKSSPTGKVAYEAKKRQWTLSNLAVSKTVRYDPVAGGLLDSAGKSEGGFELQGSESPSRELLTSGWKVYTDEPNSEWLPKAYNAKEWLPISLPFTTDQEYRSWVFRIDLTQLMKPGHRYALEFDRAVDDAAEIYANGKKIGVLLANDQPWNKVCSVPLPPKPSVVVLRLKGGGRPNGLGLVRLVETSNAVNLDLARGWHLESSKTETAQGGIKTLTVNLKGIGSQSGYSATVHYRVYPGDQPYIAKWFTLRSDRADMVLAKVRYGEVPVPKGQSERYNGSGFASVGKDGQGVCAALFDLQGSTNLNVKGDVLLPEYAPFKTLKSGQEIVMPMLMTSRFNGSLSKGALLIKLFVGKNVARTTPTSVPPVFNTWFGYYNAINGETVQKIVPIASRIGCKVFVIDDGWQTNTAPIAGNYGDWLVNKAKFPMGLEAISKQVRENGMEFGLWFAPVMVGNYSKAALDHPDWLVKRADGSRLPLWDGTSAMCLTGSWYDAFAKNVLEKCAQFNLGFVKLDGTLFVDGCIEPSHGHPISHSEGQQIDNWKDLAAKLRSQNEKIIVDRGWEAEPGVTAIQDEGWFGDWALAFHPEREADPKWWYKNADIYRRELYNLTSTRPGFTLCWETPCHILAQPLDLNALEYHFTSIGAYICNVEIHGRLDLMTPEEEQLLKKWIKWNWDNRPWLGYGQPLRCLGQGYDPRVEGAKGKVDGVLHLRPLLKGRYGYICLWNSSEQDQIAKVRFDSSDNFVVLPKGEIAMRRLKDGKPASFKQTGSRISLDVPMKPLSWEILEIVKK